jgi:hypothetical protein
MINSSKRLFENTQFLQDNAAPADSIYQLTYLLNPSIGPVPAASPRIHHPTGWEDRLVSFGIRSSKHNWNHRELKMQKSTPVRGLMSPIFARDVPQ